MSEAARGALASAAGAGLMFALACGHYGPPRRVAPAAAATLELEEPAGDPTPAESKPEDEERPPAPNATNPS